MSVEGYGVRMPWRLRRMSFFSLRGAPSEAERGRVFEALGPKHAWDAGTGMSALATTASAIHRSAFGNIAEDQAGNEASESENEKWLI